MRHICVNSEISNPRLLKSREKIQIYCVTRVNSVTQKLTPVRACCVTQNLNFVGLCMTHSVTQCVTQKHPFKNA